MFTAALDLDDYSLPSKVLSVFEYCAEGLFHSFFVESSFSRGIYVYGRLEIETITL